MNESVVRLPLVSDRPSEPRRLTLLEEYLRDQRELTAVERFSRRAEAGEGLTPDRRYHDLIPLTKPGPGQQYAFQVDLDACTGCKACVTACHSLNGLDESETWRHVGLLHGGSTALPVQQTVTTACHHCVEPACMSGCPVAAYEKDSITGIVKHLDDQCIGCQYCTLTCPYDVPKYDAKRGIVRKCDMCSDRLAADEAPACAAACPNGAITITLVAERQAVEDAQGEAFLPGAPSPGITIPTTIYKTERALPRNMLPADFYEVAPSPDHLPLVVMLVLTQLSVGAFAVDAVARRLLPGGESFALRPVHSLVALAVGLTALGASVLHLGRPRYAFRALLGLRTSWMSREILAFGVFAPLAIVYSALLWQSDVARFVGVTPLAADLAHRIEGVLDAAVVLTGAAGVLCSVLIYHVTRRPWWSASRVGFKFFLTTAVLGIATMLVTLSSAAVIGGGVIGAHAALALAVGTRLLVAASLLKLGGELLFFRHLGGKRFTALKRSATLMKRELGGYAIARFSAGAIGGLVLPALSFGAASSAQSLAFAGASLVFLLIGELLERTLFFAAVSSPGMPGGLR